MKIFLATWLEDNQGLTLDKINAKNRLLSYFFLKETSLNFLKKYVTYGKIIKK